MSVGTQSHSIKEWTENITTIKQSIYVYNAVHIWGIRKKLPRVNVLCSLCTSRILSPRCYYKRLLCSKTILASYYEKMFKMISEFFSSMYIKTNRWPNSQLPLIYNAMYNKHDDPDLWLADIVIKPKGRYGGNCRADNPYTRLTLLRRFPLGFCYYFGL